MTTRAILFVLCMAGLFSLHACGERPNRDDRTPDDAFPMDKPIEDTIPPIDTMGSDSIPLGAPTPMLP